MSREISDRIRELLVDSIEPCEAAPIVTKC